MLPHHIEELLVLPGPLRRGIDRLLRYFVLAVGLMTMTVITVPGLSTRAWILLTVILWCCLGFFAIELTIKCWPRAGAKAALGYLFTPVGIVDLLAVLPIPIGLLIGMPARSAWLLASLWLLKLAPEVPGLSLLGRVIALEARSLASVFVIFLIVLVLSSVALHVLESADQPQQFGSLPASLWWAVTTLTTTGYGDAVPQTFLGRIIAGIVMICGLGVFGLWAGILATGFAAEHRRRDYLRNWNLVTSVPFLRDLDPPAIVDLTRMLRRIDLPEHSIVVRRGRPGDCMYFIVSGEVEVRLEPKPVRLGAGSFFGEFALLDSSPRTATVVTSQPSTFLILEVYDFHAFTAQHPELAEAIEKEAKRRRDSGQDEHNRNKATAAAGQGKPLKETKGR